MTLQTTYTPADDIDAEIDRLADLTSQLLTAVKDSPDGRSALACALSLLVAAEADFDEEKADHLLRGDVFPSLVELVDENCAEPFDPAETYYLH